jgi:RHS repeat-associated protein
VGVRIAAGGARDANGSVMGLETSEGEVPDDERYDYDPYGELDRKPAVGDTTDDPDAGLSQEAQDNPFRFQGFYYDSGVKTYDMHARHYRPDTGRFLQRDQYAAAVGNQALQADTLTQNRYAFAGANPVTNVEFDGHFFSRTTFKRFLRGVSRAAQAKAPSRGRPSRREGRAYYNAATGPGGQGVRAFRESSGPTARPAPRPVVRAQSPNVGQRLLKVRSDVNSAISGYLFNPKRDGALGAGLTCGLLGKSCDKDTHDRYQDVYSRGKVYGTVLSYTGLRVLRLLQHGSRPGQRAINSGSQATKAGRGGAGPVRLGQAGEDAVRGAYNIGPKIKVDVAGTKRIPDGLTPSTLSEVKNVGSLSYTRQLRDYVQFAQQTGRRVDLYVRGGSSPTNISGPLRNALSDPSVPIRLRRIP